MTSIAQVSLFAELIDFLISSPTPEQIVAFAPSQPLQDKLDYLLDLNRQHKITADHRAELEELLRVDQLVSALKDRAQQKLAGQL
jgi:hypothetical protein